MKKCAFFTQLHNEIYIFTQLPKEICISLKDFPPIMSLLRLDPPCRDIVSRDVIVSPFTELFKRDIDRDLARGDEMLERMSSAVRKLVFVFNDLEYTV